MTTSSSQGAGELFRAVSADLRALVSYTAELAKLEVKTALSTFSISIISMAAGLVVTLLGMAVLAGALVLIAIRLGLAPWAAAVVVGLLIVITGAASAMYGLNRLRQVQLTLAETRGSVKETMEWLKQQAVG
jgi:hypothetical protein